MSEIELPEKQGEQIREMQQQVLQVLRQSDSLWATGRLVVGVSGGPDSLALLHTLRFSILPELHEQGLVLNLVAAHLNHGLRPEAGEEAAYLQTICMKWGIDFYQDKVDIPAMVQETGGSIESKAREVRYQFLAGIAEKVKASAVVVAHNADDQVETVLMNIMRGTGLTGLRGMEMTSILPGASHISLVRPLLTIPRSTIELYCWANNLQPIQDQSNLDPTFLRNRIRYELLPILEDYNPQIRRLLQNSASIWSADVNLLEGLREDAWKNILLTQGEGWLRIDLEGWQTLPLSLRRATLRYAVWTLQQSLDNLGFQSIEQARQVLEKGRVGTQSYLTGDLLLTVEYSTWTMTVQGRTASFVGDFPQVKQTSLLTVPGRVALEGKWRLQAIFVEHVDLVKIKNNPQPLEVFIQPSLYDRLFVRSRRPGERIQPLGMDGHQVKIKEVMIDRKIPSLLRADWPVVATDDFPIWVVGHVLDHRARLLGDGPAIHMICYRDHD